jgi:hypothetical protein
VKQLRLKLMNTLLIMDSMNTERQLHGQTTMLKLSSALMVMLPIHMTPANAKELFGLVEDLMKMERELRPGTNSECGKLCQKLTRLFILDATNGLLERMNLSKVMINHAGAKISQTIFQPCVLRKKVMTAFVMVE